MGFSAVPSIPANLQLPNNAELEAFRLRRRSGLKDHEVARLQGVTRETANRRIRRAQRTFDQLTRICAAGDCNLVESLMNRGTAIAG